MPRTARLINKEGKTAYHLISRTALDGFPFGDIEKDFGMKEFGVNSQKERLRLYRRYIL